MVLAPSGRRHGLGCQPVVGSYAKLHEGVKRMRCVHQHRFTAHTLLVREALRRKLGIQPAALRLLAAYPFPGNVRELRMYWNALPCSAMAMSSKLTPCRLRFR